MSLSPSPEFPAPAPPGDLGAYAALLRRRCLVFLFCLATGCAGGAALLHLTPPSYTATAQVLVSPTGVQDQVNQVTPRQREPLNLDTEAQIAKSAVVASRAAAILRATPPAAGAPTRAPAPASPAPRDGEPATTPRPAPPNRTPAPSERDPGTTTGDAAARHPGTTTRDGAASATGRDTGTTGQAAAASDRDAKVTGRDTAPADRGSPATATTGAPRAGTTSGATTGAAATGAGALASVPGEEQAMVEVSVPPNSAVLSISATAGSAQVAAAYARAYARAYLEHRAETAQQALAAQVRALAAKLRQVDAAHERIVKTLPTLPKGSPERAIAMQRHNVLSRQIYTLTGRYDALRTVAVTPGSIISEPEPPAAPSAPSPPLYLGSGVMLGLLAGAGAAVARDRLDTRLRSPRDVERLTRVAVLAELAVDRNGALADPRPARRRRASASPGPLHELAAAILAARPGGHLLVRPVGAPCELRALFTVLRPAVMPITLLRGDDLHDLARADSALLVLGTPLGSGDVRAALRDLTRHGIRVIGAVLIRPCRRAPAPTPRPRTPYDDGGMPRDSGLHDIGPYDGVSQNGRPHGHRPHEDTSHDGGPHGDDRDNGGQQGDAAYDHASYDQAPYSAGPYGVGPFAPEREPKPGIDGIREIAVRRTRAAAPGPGFGGTVPETTPLQALRPADRTARDA
ncbi:hypothetical protein GCM10023259_072030 [Thermocatellispora tengchongensis]|uniref:Wzz/FepE/Etk N-terminal domain-containing protein n=1 Tax=Thermocatellispora tengchongensis TaxID=1073253 RepID=UPI0031EF30A4